MKTIALALPIAALALALGAPARAQTVEGKLSVRLSSKFEAPSGNGSRISTIRAGTRDLIEGLMEEQGLQGRRAALVMRRDIADLDLAGVETILVVDGVDHPQLDLITPDVLPLPAAFDAFVEGFSLRRQDGALQSFAFEAVSAVQFGVLADDGFEAGLFAIDKASARLTSTRGVDLGHLYRSITSTVSGGLLLDFLGPPALPTSGQIRYGPEKIVAP